MKLGLTNSLTGDFAKALKYYKKALLIFERGKDKTINEKAEAFFRIGNMHEMLGDKKQSI